MVQVDIDGDRAVFEVQGLHRVWAMRSRLEIPLAHITAVEANPDQVRRWWHGIKIVGTDAPLLFSAGTFYYHGELVFWDISDPGQTIVVSLEHEHYKKLIVEVADVDGTVARLRAALRDAAAT